MNRITPVSDDRDVQALTDKAIDLPAPLAIVPPRVVHDQGCFLINIRHKFERQAACRDVPGVLGGVERDSQLIYRYSRKLMGSSAAAVAAIS
jgi:hypothetical protein